MKQKFDLAVEARAVGKSTCRALRNERKIPANIYGAIKNQNIYLNESDVLKYNTRKFDNTLFTLKSSLPEANGKIALIKSVDVNPLSRKPVHVDLYALDLTKAVRVSVEIKVEGKPLGLADGGLLNIVQRELEIEVLPNDIPESIIIDVSHLGVGDSFHVSELKLAPGVKVLSAPELTIAVVNLIEDEVVTPAAVAATATAATATAATAAAPAKDAKTPAAKAPAKDAKAPAAKPAGDKKK
ncbi:MAG: 50S ribosomal protein L25 [Deltaproteobacteria bacterium]|nr:50S ribosomal protein L25 [Deltaproteobacteria bacterium]